MGYGNNEHVTIRTDYPELAAQLADNVKLLPIDTTKYGAVGDGVTDCLAAFNSSVAASDVDISSRVLNPGLNIDSDANGVADNWTSYIGAPITGSLSMNNGQVTTVTASTGVGGRAVYQDIPVTVGEVIKFKVTYQSAVTAGTFSPAITVTAMNDTGNTIQLFNGIFMPNSASDTVYQSGTYTMPTGTTKLRIHLMAYANAAGDTGSATYKNFSLTKRGANSKVIKFPQNEQGNAVYYFSANPTLSGIQIDADAGVVLSFPSTNNVSFKDVVFKNNISIISRDRNNTGVQYRNDYSDLIFNTLTDNDVSVGVKKLSLVADANVQRNIYSAGSAGTKVAATLAYDVNTGMYSMANAADIAHSTSKAVTLEFDFVVNNLYSCDFQFTVAETSTQISIGVTTSLDGLNWSLYCLRLDGKTLNGINNAGVWNAPSSRDISTLLNNAYLPKTGYIVSARPIGNNKIEIYLNGVFLETITLPFAFTKIGFGMFTVNAANQGLQNTQWGRIVTGKCLKSNVGDTLKIAAFGDSITFGEGSLSWAEYLPKFLSGQKGITKVSVSNYAVSGNKSAEQLTKMQGTTLTGFDMVLILIGTNDIQSQIVLDTFKSNVQSMINLAKATYRKVVIGIPPMWIDETLTGVGAATSNYEKGAAYRSVLMQLAASNDIYIADTMSEIGRIGVDNVLNTLRDNLHPNEFGEILLARCFARSILAAVTAEP